MTLDNCEFAVAKTQFSILSFHFDHPPLPPPLTFFLRSVYWGEYYPKSAIFYHPWRDRPTWLPLFANVVFLPLLEFVFHGKMRLPSLQDCYGPWYLYICRSLVRSLDLFVSFPQKRNGIDPLHKWHLNLNNNTWYILSLTFMWKFLCLETWMWG